MLIKPWWKINKANFDQLKLLIMLQTCTQVHTGSYKLHTTHAAQRFHSVHNVQHQDERWVKMMQLSRRRRMQRR